MKEFIFTWFIENISYSWHKPGEYIASPTFVASSMQNTAWTLSFYPRGRDNSDYLSLYLFRENYQIPVNLTINFELSFLTGDLSTLHSIFVPESFKTFDFGGRSAGFGESRFIKRHEVFDRKKDVYLPQDILTLRCRMWKNDDNDEFAQIFGRTRLSIERIVSVENVHLENSMKKTLQVQSKHPSKELMSVNIEYYRDKINLAINPMSWETKTSIFKFKLVDKILERNICQHISCFFGKPQTEFFILPFSEKVLSAESDNSAAINFEISTEFVYSTGEEIKMIEKDIPARTPEFLSNYINSWPQSVRQTGYPSLSKNLWKLCTEQILCDAELKTPNKSFFVHKIVLCARSPVFLAMLTNEMKEKINNCIEIEDITANTLEKFIIFLYTDVFEDVEWNTVAELYYAADKYQVERLKFICCSYLLKNGELDNVCELLTLAERHQDLTLIQKVYDLIWRNEEKVFKSNKWKEFVFEQPQLAVKAMLSKYEERDNQSLSETFNDSKSAHYSMLDDFRTLYQDQIINDIVIKAKRTTFPAHKTVLSAYSPTFKDMLTRMCHIKQKSESTDFIEIKDLEEDTVSQMLLFLYTDSLEDIHWDTATKLYHASDAYQIQKLKFKCSCFLLEHLNVSNASDLLLLAHEHRDLNLKTAVKDFIRLYDEEIFGSDEWIAFGEANSLLAFQTMCAKYEK